MEIKDALFLLTCSAAFGYFFAEFKHASYKRNEEKKKETEELLKLKDEMGESRWRYYCSVLKQKKKEMREKEIQKIRKNFKVIES